MGIMEWQGRGVYFREAYDRNYFLKEIRKIMGTVLLRKINA